MTAPLVIAAALHAILAPGGAAAPAPTPAAPAGAAPQDPPFVQTLSPGTEYDPAIPTLAEVVGHDFDEEVTPPDDIARYLEALAGAAPERTRLVEYARSWEGRPLHALVIGSPERIGRLDEVKADLRRLASPDRLDEGEVEELVAGLPVVTALVHGVHGNEISSAGAAMAEAYHLLAARDDPDADLILRESLVLVDPAQNPDGRARFVASNTQARGRWPNADPASAAHDEPWPGGRTNHYLFDLNRDWFALSQPESRGRVALLLEYMPHVVADIHEMGGNATYYFPPAAIPGNPWVTAPQDSGYATLGRAMAGAFDRRGFAYFTREIFDAFYPGYGVSWPTAHGALGMTFEQASARGLRYRRDDGTVLTYGEGILHHWTAAMTTAATAARHREELLRDFAAFRASGVRLGREGESRTYFLHSPHDPALAARLARTLAANGIRVSRVEEAVRVAGRTLPAGETYAVPLDQPAHRLVRNLLDPTTSMDPDFVQEQIERRARRLPDEIYDVTAWSMPLLWDVELLRSGDAFTGAATPVEPERSHPDASALPEARVGYLVPWNSAGAATAAGALRAGLTVRSVGGAFTLDGREFPVGTALLRSDENPGDLPRTLGAIAARHGAEVVPVDRSYVDEGTSLGSRRVRWLPEPRVALVWDEPTFVYSAGWARFVLERRYGVPVTAVRADRLPRTLLEDYEVIVLPSGRYGSAFDDAFVDRLRTWIREGGTLVTMAESSRWASRAGLLETGTELRGGAPAGSAGGGGEGPEKPPEQPIDYLEAIAPETEPPEQTPGAILNVDLDTGHWLSAGTDGRIGALVDGSRIFTPITLDEGTNVGTYARLDELVAGGIVWEDARPQLARKAFLVHQPEGRGRLVAFAEDPNYRAYAEATALLFVNAVLLGPGR